MTFDQETFERMQDLLLAQKRRADAAEAELTKVGKQVLAMRTRLDAVSKELHELARRLGVPGWDIGRAA
jgi:hypothetical protein